MKQPLIYLKSSRTGANTSTTSAGSLVSSGRAGVPRLFVFGLKMAPTAELAPARAVSRWISAAGRSCPPGATHRSRAPAVGFQPQRRRGGAQHHAEASVNSLTYTAVKERLVGQFNACAPGSFSAVARAAADGQCRTNSRRTFVGEFVVGRRDGPKVEHEVGQVGGAC